MKITRKICDFCSREMNEENDSFIAMSMADDKGYYFDACDNCIEKMANYLNSQKDTLNPNTKPKQTISRSKQLELYEK